MVDGDDLLVYDNPESARERDQEDEQTLEQLEWELSTIDGRDAGTVVPIF